MQVVYPACFVAMTLEGAFGAPGITGWQTIGLLVLLVAKALKYWAIGSLGERWTFRVLVLPGAPPDHLGTVPLLAAPKLPRSGRRTGWDGFGHVGAREWDARVAHLRHIARAPDPGRRSSVGGCQKLMSLTGDCRRNDGHGPRGRFDNARGIS